MHPGIASLLGMTLPGTGETGQRGGRDRALVLRDFVVLQEKRYKTPEILVRGAKCSPWGGRVPQKMLRHKENWPCWLGEHSIKCINLELESYLSWGQKLVINIHEYVRNDLLLDSEQKLLSSHYWSWILRPLGGYNFVNSYMFHSLGHPKPTHYPSQEKMELFMGRG